MIEEIILVNEQDQPIGVEEKLKAHKEGLLHRAFSVFIYQKLQDQIYFLLQRRHPDKYHCGGLWTNTCCSHPRPSESIEEGATRRLYEEMSLRTPLNRVGAFCYKAEFDNGLIEHEYDHVLIGELKAPDSIASICVNPKEVSDYRWMTISEIEKELSKNAHLYTPWFEPAWKIVKETLCPKF